MEPILSLNLLPYHTRFEKIDRLFTIEFKEIQTSIDECTIENRLQFFELTFNYLFMLAEKHLYKQDVLVYKRKYFQLLGQCTNKK